MISWRLWFSITIENTVPAILGGTALCIADSCWQAVLVLPDVFGEQADNATRDHQQRDDIEIKRDASRSTRQVRPFGQPDAFS
jgi:hypothetical protein